MFKPNTIFIEFFRFIKKVLTKYILQTIIYSYYFRKWSILIAFKVISIFFIINHYYIIIKSFAYRFKKKFNYSSKVV